MRGKYIIAICLLLISTFSISQIHVHEDYVGAGNSEGILISASSSSTVQGWSDNAGPENTMNGEGLDGAKAEAARFLYQTTFGGTSEQISALARTLDFEDWIDNQIEAPRTNMLNLTRQSYQQAREVYTNLYGSSSELQYNEVHFQYAWWQAAMTRQDILRQRMAFALSEIFVISTDSDIRNDGDGIADYYDMLSQNAFGNFRDLLTDVSLHPAMSIYLSHFRNQKADPANNIYPDENFAREIMQLFTIGLFELNQDGSLQLNSNGEAIPTYDNEDIRNMAKIFTGLGAGGMTQEGVDLGRTLNFNVTPNILDYTLPLTMYDEYHSPGEKYLFETEIIPEGQTGMEDIEMALDILFSHHNVGPFIARRLIQQFIKSNPSSSFIEDIANVFDDNGEGIRGDLGAVLKAILLHEEARTCLWLTEPGNGKLKSPVGRYLQFARASVDRDNQNAYWTRGFSFENSTYQIPLASPSVFNFYLPDHQPNGEIYEMGLYAPEFQIHNSVTSVGYANEVDNWARLNKVFSIIDLDYSVGVENDPWLEFAKDPETLVNELDIQLCAGRLSDETRSIIIENVEAMNFGTDYLQYRVQTARYLIMISPDYVIQK